LEGLESNLPKTSIKTDFLARLREKHIENFIKEHKTKNNPDVNSECLKNIFSFISPYDNPSLMSGKSAGLNSGGILALGDESLIALKDDKRRMKKLGEMKPIVRTGGPSSCGSHIEGNPIHIKAHSTNFKINPLMNDPKSLLSE
jgi:hypothetical protein